MNGLTLASCLANKKVLVTGGAGFLGQHVVAELRHRGVQDILVPRKAEYDLTNFQACFALFAFTKPDVVIHLAAEVGGIGANRANPGRYLYANLAMGTAVVELSRVFCVQKVVFTGTVCSYPKHCPTPFQETNLWTGYPEETNAPYGIAKRAIMEMLAAYRAQYGLASACLLPANLYGPGDNFNPQTSHVIPALVKKFCDAKRKDIPVVHVWGSGEATREFLYVTDAARGVVDAAERIDDPAPINLGTETEISISEVALMIAGLCGYRGEIEFDSTEPDGQPRRQLDCTRARTLLQWQPTMAFDDGLAEVVADYPNSRFYLA